MQGIVILLTVVFILIGEWILWYLFRRTIADISFPRGMDRSFFRIFTIARMRIAALLHALTLCIISILALTLLW